jgi:hypothetical protein
MADQLETNARYPREPQRQKGEVLRSRARQTRDFRSLVQHYSMKINENKRITTERCRRWLPIAVPSYQLPALIYQFDFSLTFEAIAVGSDRGICALLILETHFHSGKPSIRSQGFLVNVGPHRTNPSLRTAMACGTILCVASMENSLAGAMITYRTPRLCSVLSC